MLLTQRRGNGTFPWKMQNALHWAKHIASSQSATQVPLTQLASLLQSASLQHWVAHAQEVPLFMYPGAHVKSHWPPGLQVDVPSGGATQGAQVVDP
jgi:hypothetical protein